MNEQMTQQILSLPNICMSPARKPIFLLLQWAKSYSMSLLSISRIFQCQSLSSQFAILGYFIPTAAMAINVCHGYLCWVCWV